MERKRLLKEGVYAFKSRELCKRFKGFHIVHYAENLFRKDGKINPSQAYAEIITQKLR